MLRRHPIIAATGILFFAVLVIAAVFIATFDLNRYREQAQEEISLALARPISLGEAHLSLRHGLAFSFTAIKIPPAPADLWSLDAGRLVLRIEFAPLLQGKIVFSDILLVEPRLRLVAPSAGEAAKAEAIPDIRRVFAGIKNFVIKNGLLTLEDRRAGEHPHVLTLERVQLRLLHLASGGPTWLTVAGQLRQSGAPAKLSLAGEITPASDWRQSAFRLGVKIAGVELDLLQKHFFPEVNDASGTVSFGAQLTGSPAAGLEVEGEITGEDLRVDFPLWYRAPLAIDNLRIAGAWAEKAGTQRVREVTVAADGLSAHAEGLWRRQGESDWLEATLTAPALPLVKLVRFLPDGPTAARLKQQLTGGELELEKIHFAGPSSALCSGGENLPVQASFAVHDLTWQEKDKLLTELSLTGVFAQDLLQLDGAAKLLDAPLHFAGTIENPLSSRANVTAEIRGEFATERLLDEVPAGRRPQQLIATGTLPISCSLTGDWQQLDFSAKADLHQMHARWDAIVVKPAGLAGEIAVTGAVTPARLKLRRARLHFAPLEIRAKGELERAGEGNFSLALDLSRLDLEKLQTFLPPLAMLQSRGAIEAHYELAGSGGRIKNRHGRIRLRQVGAYLGPHLASIQNINGSVKIAGDMAESREISALLGASPITISGTFTTSPAPQAAFHVRADSIRADELIFSSRQFLRDLDAHLLIDREGIDFAPATVRLDGGTAASVRGRVAFAPVPRVELDIEAKQADIDEVIALWQQPPETDSARSDADPELNAAADAKERSGLTVQIRAKVGEGLFSGLQFQQAKGEIRYENGLLNIFPLRFSVGPGTCDSRVAVEFTDSAPLLRTSGHLEKVDASVVYQQVLKREGLITGSLDGDFYLEGLIGDDFLPSSLGGFSIATKEGVLRKFKILGRVFSVLNVSQILTWQLPDMAREGMPFDLLAGNFILRAGVLSTEDLFIDSRAMNLSLIGNMNLIEEELDLYMGIKPLGTVDRIVTNIPVAGWLLTGEEKALITAQFHVHGHPDRAEVQPVPINMVSEKVFGIFRRVLNLPGRLIEDAGALVQEK